MSAYLVVIISLDDTGWVRDYHANVPAIIHKYGGEYVIVSKHVERLEGEGGVPDQVAVLSFPSIEVIREFLEDEEYAPYAKARIAGSYSDFFAIET